MTFTHGTPPPPGFPATGPQPMSWPSPEPAPRTPRRVGTITNGIAIVLSCAALGVGITALLRPAEQVAAPTPSPTSPTRPTNTTEANRAFCTAIAPLMAESNKTAQALSHLGKDSPDWNAGARTFIDETKDWVGRMQPVIDSHGDADPFLLRGMQRFVDDRRFLIADLQGGSEPKWLPYDQTGWDDSLIAGSGPLNVCWNLGVKW